MADLNKIMSAQTVIVTDGVSQEAEIINSIPAGTETALAVRDACIGQQTMANSRPVTIASNQSAITVVGSGNFGIIGTLTNNNAAPAANNVGVLTALANAAAPTWTEGNQVLLSTDLAGNLRVTVSGSGTQQVVGNVASGNTDSGNPVKIGAVGHTANPTAVTDGQRVDLVADKVGRLVVVTNHVRDLVGNQYTGIAGSAETTIVTAGGANVFRDLVFLSISSDVNNIDFTIRDSTGGSTIWICRLDADQNLSINFDPPLKQTTANNNWTIQANSGGASYNVLAQYVNNV